MSSEKYAGAAAFAGPRTGKIPLSAPLLSGGNESKYLLECLESGWVSSAAPFVDRFEAEAARCTGARHAVAVVNGTAALHTALRVVGVQAGDEVIVSDLTFIAPVNAIRYCGAEPVLMDAHPETWQMDADKVERFLARHCLMRAGACFNRKTGRRVRAIVPVHILGSACDMDRIVELAGRFSLRVVEDAAEAMGVRRGGRHVGTFGDIGIFSFNGNKIITCGGGGMLVTGSSELAARARYLTTQARDDNTENVHGEVGYNYRLTGLQAALGLAQLERLEAFVEKRRSAARVYESFLRGINGVTLPGVPEDVRGTYWLFTFLLSEETSMDERREVIAALERRQIETRPLWRPVHLQPPYRNCSAFEIEQTDRLFRRAVSLPSGAGLEEAQLSRCIEALHGVIGGRA